MNKHILGHEHLQFKKPSGTDSHLGFGCVKVIVAIIIALIQTAILQLQGAPGTTMPDWQKLGRLVSMGSVFSMAKTGKGARTRSHSKNHKT